MSKIINLEDERNKKRLKKTVINIIFILSLIYIAYAIYLIVRTPTDTVTVEKGTLTSEETVTGYIIRDETVIQGNNYKNGIYQIIQDGEKVAKNQTVFRYYGKNEQELQSKIEEIDGKLQKAMEEEDTELPSDVKNLESQIDEKIKNINKLTNIQTIQEYKKDISELILKKAIIVGEESPKGSYIKELITQREEYENELMEDSEYVTATDSGVLSYRVDGLENVLTTDDFSTLSEETLNNLDIRTGKIISTSNESAKIIKEFGCYIAFFSDSDEAKNAKEGDSVVLTLSSGEEVNATIEYLKQDEGDKLLIIFKLNTLTEELISYRKISFNITWWNYSGIKVPNDSIKENEDGLKYVIKKTTTGNKEILIKVLRNNGNYSIINTYSTEDLQALGIDLTDYDNIDVHDTILLYPD